MPLSDKQWEMMQNATYLDLLLVIIGGTNYASAIARKLKKRQPTVTEQLKALEKAHLVIPLKREKSQRYEASLSAIEGAFYSLVDEILTARKHYIGKEFLERTRGKAMESALPRALIDAFLKEYIGSALDLGGKRKGIDELILSFFKGLTDLKKDEWKELAKKFNFDEGLLGQLADYMAFEISMAEHVALQTLT